MINYEKIEESQSYHKQNICFIYKKEFSADDDNESIIERERDHCHYTGKYREVSDNVYNLRYKNQKKISVVFHNGSTYDYYIIMEELGEQFKGHFECSGENAEKYITFSIPIKR